MALIVPCNSPVVVLHSSRPYWLTLEAGFKARALRHKNMHKQIETDILHIAMINLLKKPLTSGFRELFMVGLIFIRGLGASAC
jgi:hypothetical protein